MPPTELPSPADPLIYAELPEALRLLQTDPLQGLAPGEVVQRQQRFAPNELPSPRRNPLIGLILEQLRSLMTLVLIGAAALSWLLGERADAAAILAIVVLNAGLGVIQEYRAEQAVAAIARWNAPRARVLRGGRVREVAARELVPGDVVLLEAGDRVPADLRLVEAYGLHAEEAALTGESAPVTKSPTFRPPAGATLAADMQHLLFMGTSVVSGSGRAVVIRTGLSTELGNIARMVGEAPEAATPLQVSLEHLARWLLGLCAGAVVVVFGVGVAQGQPWFDMLMVAVSLAVAAIPEGLPAAVTAALALGVQRMSRRRAIVRRLAAVETLGCASVICSDKTGTLTRNEMAVVRMVTPWEHVRVTGRGLEPRGAFHRETAATGPHETPSPGPAIDPLRTPWLSQALLAGLLCSRGDVHRDRQSGRWVAVGDPTEAALVVAAQKAGLSRAAAEARFRRLLEVPFEPERRMMSVLVRDSAAGRLLVATKGAPGTVLARCRHILNPQARPVPLPEALRRTILQTAEHLAGAGLRVLAVATRELPAGTPPPDPPSRLEADLTFVALVGMEDPPREDVAAAIATARAARVRTLMVTGDHPATARAVAAAVGLAAPGQRVVTGSELERMDDGQLQETLEQCAVYARVSPAHKRRLVQVLRRAGHVVAMTGDGVNDAPALREADIGIAMGLTGTDVARQASALVLTDDNYATIVAAIEEGRTIYENIRRFIRYLLACNAGEVLVMLAAGLLGWPVPLLPLQILWVNLVTDGLPALALGLLPPSPTLMRRGPRPRRESLFARGGAEEIVEQGLIIGLTTLMAFGWVLARGGSLQAARSVAFGTLVTSQLVYALRCGQEPGARLRLPRVLATGLLVSAGMQFAVMALPAARVIMDTTWPTADQWAVIGAASLGVPMVQGVVDRLWYAWRQRPWARLYRPRPT